MKAHLVVRKIQKPLLVPVDGQIGLITRAAFNRLALMKAGEEFMPDSGADQDLGHNGEDGARDINARAVALVKHFESCYLRAYLDPVNVWTIGWGHTGLQHKDGTVFGGRVISQEKADQLFRYDMEQFEARVVAGVKVPLTEDQYGALVSFDFNTGGLLRSTLLKVLNQGRYDLAANEFLKWNRAGGKVMDGLTRRRRSERRLFLGKEHHILYSMAEVAKDANGTLA